MRNSEYKKTQGLAAQTGISLRKRDLKMLHRTKGIKAELAHSFPQFIYEASGQTLTGKAYSARLRMYRHPIPGAIRNYMYLKYKEVNIQNTSNPLI